jgi:hypothetical protein
MRFLAALTLLALTLSAQTEAGFIPLFDGKSLNGWQIIGKKGPGYVVENGALMCPEKGGGNLYTKDEYANFVFRFEFRLSPGGNNGIGIRAPLQGDAAYAGMEIQVLDDGHELYKGQLKPEQHHGSVYDVIPARSGYLKAAGEWNQEEIVADGRHIRVTLNGVIILDTSLDIVRESEVLKRHPGLARPSGYIGFLGHDSKVEFRNIRVKRLP